MALMGIPYPKSGGPEGILVLDPMLAKPRIHFPLASENVLERFINDKRNTKGLTISGEEWLRDTEGRFLRWLPAPLPQANREHIVRFLGCLEFLVYEPQEHQSQYVRFVFC